MNLFTWGPQALGFAMWFAIAAVPGTGGYWLFRTQLPAVQVLSFVLFTLFVAGYILSATQIWTFIIDWRFLLIQPSLAIGISFGQAFLEHALNRPRSSWFQELGICLATNLCLICAGRYFFLGVLTSLHTSPALLRLIPEGVGQRWSYFLGLLLTPFSISFYRWMLPHLGLRPGIDRELEEGEARA